MATSLEIGLMLGVAMASYPNYRKPGEDDFLTMTEAYTRILGHLPADVVAAAFDLAVTRSVDFLPPAPKVLEAAGQLAVRGSGSNDNAAFEQWGEVERHIRDYSPDFPTNDPRYASNYAAARFDDPITQAVVEMFGGIRMLHASDNPAADRARFIEAYRTQVRRAGEQYAELPGVSEMTKKLESTSGRDLPALPGGEPERRADDALAQDWGAPRASGQALRDVAAAIGGWVLSREPSRRNVRIHRR